LYLYISVLVLVPEIITDLRNEHVHNLNVHQVIKSDLFYMICLVQYRFNELNMHVASNRILSNFKKKRKTADDPSGDNKKSLDSCLLHRHVQ
jgi:hypothetical protein